MVHRLFPEASSLFQPFLDNSAKDLNLASETFDFVLESIYLFALLCQRTSVQLAELPELKQELFVFGQLGRQSSEMTTKRGYQSFQS